MSREELEVIIAEAAREWDLSDQRTTQVTRDWIDKFSLLLADDLSAAVQMAQELYPNRFPTVVQVRGLIRKARGDRLERERNLRELKSREHTASGPLMTNAEAEEHAEQFATQAAERRRLSYEAKQAGQSAGEHDMWARYMEEWAEYCSGYSQGDRSQSPPSSRHMFVMLGLDREDPEREYERQRRIDRVESTAEGL